MNLADELRRERLLSLYTRFLEGAKQYPGLYHVCLGTEEPAAFELFHRGQVHPGAEYEWNCIWNDALDEAMDHHDFSGRFLSPHSREMRFGASRWCGRYIQLFIGDATEYKSAEYDFAVLAAEALVDCGQEEQAPESSGADVRWLQVLYGCLDYRVETARLEDRFGFVAPVVFNYRSEFYVAGEFREAMLPWNVFTASAKAIEVRVQQAEYGPKSDHPVEQPQPEAPVPTAKKTKPKPRIQVDVEQRRITLDGTPYEVTYEAACWVAALVEARGNWESSTDLNVTKPDRLKKTLPMAIQKVIKSTPGKGSRILPEKQRPS